MKNILISRTDALGDVILTLPMATLLKEKFPNSKIFFLSKDYTQNIINRCNDIDERISYDHLLTLDLNQQINFIKSKKIDLCIHVFPKKDLASLMKKSDIPNRIGTSRRIYHWLTCNQKINFTRKKSNLHESQLNLKLLEPLGISSNLSTKEIYQKFNFNKNYNFIPENIIDPNRFNLIIHPFAVTGVRWPIEKYAQLVTELDSEKFNLIMTGIQSDLKSIPNNFPMHLIHNLIGKTNLDQFIDVILQTDGLIAGSTGPLHIAAVLGKKVLGLYPNEAPIHPLRWKPIGVHAHHMVYNSLDKSSESVKNIPVDRVIKNLNELIEL